MIYLDAASLRLALPMPEAIDAMEVAFGDDREVPVRTRLAGSLFMPGRVGADTGVKVVSVVPGNPSGLVAVFGSDGGPLGVVDGVELTRIRTGAASGLASRLLAPEGARVLAMLGAGAMAADQVAAVRSVRPIEQVLVWSRSRERAESLVARVGGEVVSDPDEAVAAADVVCCATPATDPLFSDAAVRAGAHVNAVGAFTPVMAEVPPDTLRRAFVVVDDVEAAAAEAGDLIRAGRAGDATMADLLTGRSRAPAGGVTVFKSVGIASQDVAAAVAALRRAERLGLGVHL